MHSRTLSIVAVALVATASPALAQASEAKGVIDLAHFDLTTASGKTELDRTIRRTALQACATESVLDAPQAKHLQRLCYEDAVANARAQIAGHTAERAAAGHALAVLDTAQATIKN